MQLFVHRATGDRFACALKPHDDCVATDGVGLGLLMPKLRHLSVDPALLPPPV